MRINIKSNWYSITSLVIILLIVDQVSKVIVKLSMSINEAIYVIGEWFQIRFIENPGAAYGFEISEGAWGKLLLSLIRIVSIAALGYYINVLLKKKAPRGVLVAFTLIFAGALGNLLDSMFYGLIFSESTYYDVATTLPFGEGYASFLHGKVVDMFYFPIIDTAREGWQWLGDMIGDKRFIFFSPIFNVADVYISVGFLYLLIFQRRYFSEKEIVKKGDAESSDNDISV